MRRPGRDCGDGGREKKKLKKKMKREVSSLFFHPYASHTPFHDAQPCPKDLGVPERERKKRETEKDDDDAEDAVDAEDVVRSAILPKEKKRVELSRVDQVSRV